MGRSHSLSLFSRCRSTTATSSYVSPLLDGLLEGLGEDLHVGGSLHFGLPVGGDFEAHLQCWKQKVRTHGRSNRVSPEPSERKRTPRRNKDSCLVQSGDSIRVLLVEVFSVICNCSCMLAPLAVVAQCPNQLDEYNQRLQAQNLAQPPPPTAKA